MRALALAVVVLAGAPAAAEAKLVFEREDGTVIRSAAPRVWCGPWDEEVATPTLHVGTRSWHLGAVRRDLLRGKAFTFPHSFVFDEPSGAELFVAAPPDIEASTDTERSRGRLFFTRISCRPGAIVAFRIDAVVGSEFGDGEPVTVRGRFRGRVGTVSGPIP